MAAISFSVNRCRRWQRSRDIDLIHRSKSGPAAPPSAPPSRTQGRLHHAPRGRGAELPGNPIRFSSTRSPSRREAGRADVRTRAGPVRAPWSTRSRAASSQRTRPRPLHHGRRVLHGKRRRQRSTTTTTRRPKESIARVARKKPTVAEAHRFEDGEAPVQSEVRTGFRVPGSGFKVQRSGGHAR